MQVARLAIVGAGEFGARYVASFREVSGAKIEWVCDRNRERAESLAGGISGAHPAADLEEVCSDPRVDAIVVVTPEGAHRAVAELALRAGKHIIVEKPLATTEEDARAMIDAAESAGKL